MLELRKSRRFAALLIFWLNLFRAASISISGTFLGEFSAVKERL